MKGILSQEHSFGQDFNKLCKVVSVIDTKLRRFNARRIKDTTSSSQSIRSRQFARNTSSTQIKDTNLLQTVIDKEKHTSQETFYELTSQLTCYNCQSTSHYSRDCTKPKRSADIKEIAEKEYDSDSDSGKEEA